MTRAAAEARGRWGEAAAARHLEAAGWTILATRVRTKAGEVDLVARRPGLIAFVEVKTRTSPAALDLAIDQRRLVRVAAAAELLAPRYATAGQDIRVDVILVAPGGSHGPATLRHIENAWLG